MVKQRHLPRRFEQRLGARAIELLPEFGPRTERRVYGELQRHVGLNKITSRRIEHRAGQGMACDGPRKRSLSHNSACTSPRKCEAHGQDIGKVRTIEMQHQLLEGDHPQRQVHPALDLKLKSGLPKTEICKRPK